MPTVKPPRKTTRKTTPAEQPFATQRVHKPRATRTYAVVRLQVPGFHCWPGALGERSYLANRHRHLFHVEVRLQVHHDEREVEFHDLLDLTRASFRGGEMGDRSCETMAHTLRETILSHFPGRRCQVGVFEDGEVGALVTDD